HVTDSETFEFPRPVGEVHIPQPFALEKPIVFASKDLAIPVKPLSLHLTKFMVLEMAAALLVTVIFIRIARKVSKGQPPRGKLWNLFEAMLVFIRDEIARPAIGHHDGD